MQDFAASELVTLMVWLQRVLLRAEEEDSNSPLPDDQRVAAVQGMKQLRAYCERYDMEGCETLASVIEFRIAEMNWGHLKENLTNLQFMLTDGCARRRFLYLTPLETTYYEVALPIGELGAKAFPHAEFDAREAANCFALGRYTAAVFHAMRALEHGLMALAIDVGRSYSQQQWHNIIDEIESEIEKLRKNGPKTPDRDKRLNFLAAAAKEFAYFKDGWRNYVMHARVEYDALQAESALRHAQSLLTRLTAGLSGETLQAASEAMVRRSAS
jgi:HEPN domain-containing protein